MDYYRKQYEIGIREPKQPLLVSMPKEKDKKRPDVPQGPVLLVPELCALTGKSSNGIRRLYTLDLCS